MNCAKKEEAKRREAQYSEEGVKGCYQFHFKSR
jgi:hypothetical protein